jgi:hypothetical protein
MITVTVTGYGKYAVSGNKVDELINWLKANSTTAESGQSIPDGQSLLNESKVVENPYPVGSPEHFLFSNKHGN